MSKRRFAARSEPQASEVEREIRLGRDLPVR